MSVLDLLRARADLIGHARPAISYCRSVGIDWRRTEKATGGIFLAPVVAEPPRSFRIDPAGADAVVLDALDERGSTVDLVSWRPGAPMHWRTFSGRAPALGMAAAMNPNRDGPLRLWRAPETWCQAGCDGAVLLDMALGLRWLLDLDSLVPSLAAEDEDHAATISAARRAIVSGQRIMVPARARTAVAA